MQALAAVLAIVLMPCCVGYAQVDSLVNLPSIPNQLWAPGDVVPSDGKTNRRLKPLDDLFTLFLKVNQLPGVTVAATY